jgi:5-methylcytosine-specific restriction endonuclease McrA
MECPDCHHVFKSMSGYQHHVTEQVCQNRANTCETCGKHFTDKRNYVYHLEHGVCGKKIPLKLKPSVISDKKMIEKLKEENQRLKEQIISSTTTEDTPIEPISLANYISMDNTELIAQISHLQIELLACQKYIQMIEVQSNSKKKKKHIPKILRQIIWNMYGKKTCKCYCCGENEIDPFEFEAGHIISDSVGGLITVENLRPVCPSCNGSMGNQNMRDFVHTHFPKSPLLKEVVTSP